MLMGLIRQRSRSNISTVTSIPAVQAGGGHKITRGSLLLKKGLIKPSFMKHTASLKVAAKFLSI